MAIHPDSNFPLRMSDQAEVISIFLSLMHESHRAEQPFDFSASEPIGPVNDTRVARFPGELPEIN
jgi:hypothetical protein